MKAWRMFIILLTLLCITGIDPSVSSADPLDNWHLRYTVPKSSYLSSACYANGLFVVVGSSGTILTSSDGITWTQRNSGTTKDLSGVAYGGGIFVISGGTGTILTSSDGVNWTNRNCGISSDLALVAYGNGVFVVIAGCKVITSSDGVSWSPLLATGSLCRAYDDWLAGIAFGSGFFVAAGNYLTVVTSPDGITWTLRKTYSYHYPFFNMGYGNGIFVGVGAHDFGGVQTSTDAITWTPRSVETTYNNLFAVGYGNGTFIVGGSSGHLFSSTDGINWTPRHSGTSTQMLSVAFGNDTFIVGDGVGNIWQSDPVGSKPDISVTPNPVPFGNVNIGDTLDQSITVSNEGTANLVIGRITNPSPPFSKASDTCSGQPIAPASICTVTYTVSPTLQGSYHSNSNIPSNDPDHKLLTITLSANATSGLSAISGTVYDSSTGNRLQDVSVQIDGRSTATDSLGRYSISGVPEGGYTLTASKTGYYEHSEFITFSSGSSLTANIALTLKKALGEIQVLSISSKYRGFLHYLAGTDFSVVYTATVDWGGHSPGKIRFITPKGAYDILTAGTTASKTFNILFDFEPCTTLKVIAISSDGATSGESSADFTVMSPILGIGLPMTGIDMGDGFYYKTEQGFDLSLIDEGIDEGIIPKDIPLFGKEGFNLRFVPTVEMTAEMDGTVSVDLDWENKPLFEGKVAGFDYSITPSLQIEGTFLHPGCSYQWSGYVGLSGSFSVKKSWPFVFPAGPILVPMYVKASMELSADMQLGVTGWPPQDNLNFRGHLDPFPYVRGSLGAGVDDFLSVEGWIGGGANLGLQWPEEPHLEDLSLYLNGGVTITALFWKYEDELLRWDWDLIN